MLVKMLKTCVMSYYKLSYICSVNLYADSKKNIVPLLRLVGAAYPNALVMAFLIYK